MNRLSFNFPIDIGENTWLTLLKPEQAPILFELTDSNRYYLRRWLPWLDSCQNISDSASFIQEANDAWEQNKGLTCWIWYQGKLVGVVGFHAFDWEHKSSGIGYWLDESHQGKGIMTRACKALVDLGFRNLGLQTITINCAVENLSSQKVAQRLGFNFTAIKKDAEWLYDHHVDHHVYTMYADAWMV